MIRPQFILDTHDELIVDGFAGGGGASTGLEMALGRQVDHAFNHALDALGMHRINHPQTIHHCEDIFDVHPARVTEGRRVGAGWFSPDCKHFSKAKGGKPLSKKIRGLAFSILRWASIRTRVIYMENVEEIKTWGPLLRNHKPDPKRRGRTWRAFLAALGPGVPADHPDLDEMVEVLKDPKGENTITREQLIGGFGYQVEHRELRACDYGAPTIRKRMYLVARCDGLPIVWPWQTHFSPKELKARIKKWRAEIRPGALKPQPWKTVAGCIDWNIPCKSIFLTKQQAKAAKCKRPLARATLRRIATGIDRYVLKAENPFLVSLTHQRDVGSNSAERVEPIDEPARTITGANRGEKALVEAVVAPAAGTAGEGAGPAGTPGRDARATAEAPFITEHANGSNQRNMPADEPGRTQCAEVKGGHFAVVSGTVVGVGVMAGQSRPRGLDEAMHTTTAKADSVLAAATLTKFHGSHECRADGDGRNHSPENPLPVQDTANRFGLVAASMVQNGHLSSNSKMVKGADEPLRCQTTRAEHAVAATLVQTGYGEAPGQKPRALDIEKPCGTVVGGGKHALVAASLTKFNTGSVGSELTEPSPTVTAGSHAPDTHPGGASVHGLVAANLHAYYGSEPDGQPMDEPLRTISTKPRFGLTECTAEIMTPEQLAGAARVARFLRRHGVVFEGEFATVRGYVIVDIGMRMLTPRELFRCQGFSDDYVIDRAWIIDPHSGSIREVALTKSEQIRMCGNSVCPPMAEALVAANSGDLAAWQRGERKTFQRKDAERQRRREVQPLRLCSAAAAR